MPDDRQAGRQAFLAKLGRPRFSPEMLKSLERTMVAAGCLTERLWAAVRFRTWNYASEAAVSSWTSDAWYFDKLDFALDLWLEDKGVPLLQIEAMTREQRDAERVRLTAKEGLTEEQRQENDEFRAFRFRVYRAFRKLKEVRKQVDFEGHKIYALGDPPPLETVDRIPKFTLPRNFSTEAGFLEWAKIYAPPQIYEALVNAPEARKFARETYPEYLATVNPDAAILLSSKRDLRKVGRQVSEEVVAVDETTMPTYLPTSEPTASQTPPAEEKPRTGEEAKRDALRTAIEGTGICQKVGATLGHTLLLKIEGALGRAPVSQFVATIVSPRNWARINSLGFLIDFATDTRLLWEKAERQRQAQEAERASAQQYDRAAMLAQIRDPNLTPEDRETYLQSYPELREEVEGSLVSADSGALLASLRKPPP